MAEAPQRPKRWRTFVAIALPDAIRGQIAARLASVVPPPPVDIERLHLTLHFLGATVPTQIPAIEACLTPIAGSIRPFELRLQGVGAFPRGSAPNTVCLGVTGGSAELGELERLASVVRRALVPLGFPVDPRAFQAHVTLTRSKASSEGSRLLSVLRPLFVDPVGPMRVKSMALFRSETLPDGPRYTRLASFPFA